MEYAEQEFSHLPAESIASWSLNRQVDAYRSKFNGNCDKIQKISQQYDLDNHFACTLEKEQVDLMQQVHKKLIFKISNAVDNVKKSRLGGFFSPRRLKNRIKLGNFERIVWSPVVARRQELSPWSRNWASPKQKSYLAFKFKSKKFAIPDGSETTKTLKSQDLRWDLNGFNI